MNAELYTLKKYALITAALWISTLQLALAFPSWMGVYGTHTRHNGANPGVFTVLQNQDYPSLRAELGIKIGSGPWQMFQMSRAGKIDINSIWTFSPSQPFPANTPVLFFFHGYDSAGGHIWDSNGGQNYTFTIPGPVSVQWLGNISHWPPSGEIDPIDDFWINAESWPLAGGVAATVVYTTNRWTTWHAAAMNRAGKKGNNDWWNLNLGKHFGGTEIEYAVTVIDAFDKTIWERNGGANFRAIVNPGASTLWIGNQTQWPMVGNVTSQDDFWVNVESWPQGSALLSRILYSINGGIWFTDPMVLAGKSGNNDWWHINLQTYPPGSIIYYTTETTDQNGLVKTSSSGYGRAFVNGSTHDSDADQLSDDWERYWWGNLNANASDNSDGDGSPEMPLINSLELQLGTEPVHSNEVASIPFIWKPTHPVQRGLLRLSYEASAHQLLQSSNLHARVTQLPADISTSHGPMTRNPTSGRFETNITLSSHATNVIVSFVSENRIDDNRGFTWIVPVRPLAPHLKPDSDDDGMSDEWETAHQLDPLDNGTFRNALGPHGDLDGDGFDNLAEFDAGSNPRNVRSTPDTMNDDDDDGMIDTWEFQIIDHRIDDKISGIEHVRPHDDFDSDGILNIEEFIHQSDPVNPTSRPANVLLVAPQPAPHIHATNIQNAVDLAAEGGWVLLAPGEYQINSAINTRGKRITIRGIGRIDDVIISPAFSRAFVFQSGENPSTVVERLTIRKATSTSPGGAILCDRSSPSLREILFLHCYSTNVGGAVYVERSAPIFDRVIFSNCTSYVGGGAIAAHASTGLVIKASTFAENYAIGTTSDGGALHLVDSSLQVVASFFHKNSADRRGGVAFIRGGSQVFDHCTHVANRAGEGQGSVLASTGGNLSVRNSIIWKSAEPEIYGSGFSVSHSVVADTRHGPGNISADPQLVPGSFRLLAESSCMNAAAPPMQHTDIDGEGAWGAPDMGCDEMIDADDDGAADAWEQHHATNAMNATANSDEDFDELSLVEEYRAGTWPGNSDTDGDGLPDGWEIHHFLNPVNPGDALSDLNGSGLPAIYEFHQASAPASTPAVLSGDATIQQLIDTAPDFGVIELPDGIYSGPGFSDLVLTGKNLLITSANGADTCVIDCEGAGRGITFGFGADSRTVVRGITIKNGNTEYVEGEGGAIRCINADPVIDSCLIVSNRAEIGGGGIYLENSSTIIKDTLIAHNTASYNRGGGVSIVGGNPRIERSVIIGNQVPSSGHQGGGGVYADGGKLQLFNTVLAKNYAERNGGGLYFGNVSQAEIINCTIVSNRPGGVFNLGDATLHNNIIWGNNHNIISPLPGGRPVTYSVVEGMSAPSHGVLNQNPALHPETYMLTFESPCIDAGSSAGAPDRDIHNEYRWDHPDQPNLVSPIDIGADEFVDLDIDGLDDVTEYRIGSNPISPDSDGDGLSDNHEYGALGTSPVLVDSDGDSFTDREEVEGGMLPLNSRDGRALLESARRSLIGHWRTIFGEFPVFIHPPGSREDLLALDQYLAELSDAMVREVYP